MNSKGRFNILSVRRLSDGEEFSIGDHVNFGLHDGNISDFTVIKFDGLIRVFANVINAKGDTIGENINSIQKSKEHIIYE